MTTIETTTSMWTDTWKLLVIGGFWFPGSPLLILDDVEKVDPNKKSSKCEKPMPYPTHIYGPTVQAFPDQSILSCGGRDGMSRKSRFQGIPVEVVKSCYEYNPINLSWSYVTDMTYARGFASSVLLNANEIWIVGGYGTPYEFPHHGYRNDTEIYDRKTNSFRKGPDLPVYMRDHCMTKLNATHVFIGGGRSIEQNNYWYYDTSFLVDIREEPFVFHMLPKTNKSRRGAGCGVIRFDSKNGKMNQGYNTSSSKGLIIMAGGFSFAYATKDSEIFNIEENRWYTGPTIPRGFSFGGSASLGDGSMILVGGQDENDYVHSDVIRLNPSLMEFETMEGELEAARYGFGMAVLLNNEKC